MPLRNPENKADEQTETGNDSSGKGGGDQEPTGAKTIEINSASPTTEQDSKSGSTNNGRTSEKSWGDFEEDDNFKPQNPPGWKIKQAGNEKTDTEVDDGRTKQRLQSGKTASKSKAYQGKGSDNKAEPPSQPSTPRTVDSPIGGLTFDLNGGNPLGPLEQIVQANQDNASSPAPANGTSPAQYPTSGLPQNLEITK